MSYFVGLQKFHFQYKIKTTVINTTMQPYDLEQQ